MRLLRLSGLVSLFVLTLCGPLRAENNAVHTESVVIFNTVCAKCHEAQCSGRLSFDDALDAAANHIARYYGDASGNRWLQEQLFVVLNHMKEKCAYYPMDTPVPAQLIWGPELLAKLSTYLEKNYFIPVGYLGPGNYRLELAFEQDEKVTVHLVSETFAMVIEDCHQSEGKRLEIPFSIVDGGNHYVRLYPARPVELQRLAVVALDDDAEQD